MDKKYIGKVILYEPIEAGGYLQNLPAVRHLMEHGSLAFHKDVTCWTE